jgi:hypothetical protein
VVAARLRAPEAHERLLRRLRVRRMAGGLLDDPGLIAAAARDAGLDPAELERWCAAADVRAALAEDVRSARAPAPAARALDHKLGGPQGERRYTAPSYELRRQGDVVVIPGFNPVEAYETAIAHLAPELARRERPAAATDLLAWAGEPLATAEIAAVMQGGLPEVRAELARVARPIAAGADCYWTLDLDRTSNPG